LIGKRGMDNGRSASQLMKFIQVMGERPFADCAERWGERPLKSTLIVMTTYGKNINIVIIKLVDESVFLRDTP
jgi:hypothetical protein